MSGSRSDFRDLAAQFRQDHSDDAPKTVEASPDVDLDAAIAERMAAAGAGARHSEATTALAEDPEPEVATPAPTPALQKAKRTRRPASQTAARQVTGSGMTKTTVQLPNRLVDQLRTFTDNTGRSNADAVLSAYINQAEAVKEEFAPTADDKRRVELGLPPLATASNRASTSADERRVQVGLYVRASAIDEVDATAKELSLSRSEFVGELLERELAG